MAYVMQQPGQVMMMQPQMVMQPQVQMMAPEMIQPQSNYVLGGGVGYAGQMGSGTGLMDTSNSVLTNRNKALTSIAQVKVKEAQFVAEAEGARVIAEGYQALLGQSQVIIRRNSGIKGEWNILSYNKLPMYEAQYCMLLFYC